MRRATVILFLAVLVAAPACVVVADPGEDGGAVADGPRKGDGSRAEATILVVVGIVGAAILTLVVLAGVYAWRRSMDGGQAVHRARARYLRMCEERRRPASGG